MSDNMIRREFQAEVVPVGDGRTLDLRIVPHGVAARVSDDGGRTFYEEEWVRGVFRNKDNKPKTVLVNVEHEKGFAAIVGRGVSFSDSPEGFDGEFRLLNGPDADKALELVNDEVYTGVSVEAVPIKSERTADGRVRRISAKLVNVSLCRFPAFPGAAVMAVREAVEPEPDPDPDPEPAPAPQPDSDLVPAAHVDDALERIGVTPLTRMAIVERPWDKSPDRFSDEEYERSCLVARSLPVLEPSGELNVHAMHEAAKNLNNSSLAVIVKGEAARKLIRYYRIAGEEPSSALVAMASR